MLFGAKSWSEAREEYAEIMPELSGADRERAQLRILECEWRSFRASEMVALQIPTRTWTQSVWISSEYYRRSSKKRRW